MSHEEATLGGGCFWCLDAVFRQLRGVEQSICGYAGGQVDQPDYRLVCTGTTGHAEVVRVRFDPAIIDYETLLRVFFAIHDPTTPDRQGADVGTQYRSVIFHHSEAQKATAEALIAELTREQVWSAPIVTRLLPVPQFHPAEDYHQDYFRHNPGQGYCQVVIAPKVHKLRSAFQSLLRD